MNLIRSCEELLEHENEAFSKLDKCEYAGELILTEIEMDNLIEYLREFLVNRSLIKVKCTFLIVVTNIAYFYYDEYGFWIHFCYKFNVDSFDININEVGNIIEQVLVEKNFLIQRRRGPFRYVGSILEQSGITKRYIPAFTQIIKDVIKNKRVKDKIMTSYPRYNSFINNIYCSKYLREYLLDRAGWLFTVQVIKIISYLEDRLIEVNDIPDIKGFHRSFWEDFFQYYSIEYKQKLKEVQSFSKPIIKINLSNMKVYILLHSNKYQLKSFKHGPSNHNEIQYIYLDSIEKILPMYKGIFDKNGSYPIEWEISGLDIKNNNCFYFNEDFEYLGYIDSLASGFYYALALNESYVKLGRVVSRVGVIKIDNINLEIFKIKVRSKGIFNEEFNMRWERESDVDNLKCEYDIFFEKLPNLNINKAYMLRNSTVFMLYDLGDGPKRIKDYEDLWEIKNDTRNMRVFAGSIWIDSLDRKKPYMSRATEKKFCVIPKSNIKLPDKIYSNNEEIFFKCDSKFFKFENCTYNHSLGEYIIKPSTKKIHGSIVIRNKKISICYDVNRIELILKQNGGNSYIDYVKYNYNTLIELNFIPNYKVTIGIISNNVFYPVIEDVITDQFGKFTLKYNEIQIKILDINPIYANFAVAFNEDIYITGKSVIAYSLIVKNLKNVDVIYDYISIIKKSDTLLGKKIENLYKIYHNSEYVSHFIEQDTKDMIYSLIICISTLIDNNEEINLSESQLRIIGSYEDGHIIKDTLMWIVESRKAIIDCNYNKIKVLIDKYETLKWRPKIQRWDSLLDGLFNELKNNNDITFLLNEWEKEVMQSSFIYSKSRISSLNGGKDLTKAWEAYRRYDFNRSIELLELIDYQDDNIVDKLKRVLACIIYIRSMRINSLDEITSNINNDNEIDSLIFIFKNYCSLINNEEIKVFGKVTDPLLNALPLHNEDMKTLKNINLIISNYKDKSYLLSVQNNDNWIVILLIYKILQSRKSCNIELRHRIMELSEIIPESPDKHQILRELY